MFSRITLEVSLKPFYRTDPASIREVAEQIFLQWKPLCKNRKTVAVMLWTADGSEILDYTGELDRPFEWCKFVGAANPPAVDFETPYARSLHAFGVLYRDDIPTMTYRILRDIVSALKEMGRRVLGDGVEIAVGETFDIGPEFAISEFKYRRHPEICVGRAMRSKCFINSYGILNGDDYPYAGYPQGIPDGTPFGTFLGRQSQIFLTDMGCDFLWLSNGVGFSSNPWTTSGVVFDGSSFDADRLAGVREKVFDFWTLFRAECPDFPLETRGTNMSAGIDYATDAVPLYELYNADLKMLAPPNSPWAALDSNFGLELMGHMSRICHLPSDGRFQFRYYVHDPWWSNSPWYDRYEGQPHDIYLPMALGRIDEAGEVNAPTDLHLLSIDNSWGDLPDSCANEPIPHLLKAEKDAPDAPSPLVWIYPLREYTTAKEAQELNRMFSNDWFVSGAINCGLPLSTVVTSDIFLCHDPALYRESILFTPAPEAGSPLEEKLLSHIRCGGRVLFYGPLDHASPALLSLLNLHLSEETAPQEITVDPLPCFDRRADGRAPSRLAVRRMESAGTVNTCLASESSAMRPLITAGERVLAVTDGQVAWFRASVSASYKKGVKHLVPDDATKYLLSEAMIRRVLSSLGMTVRFSSPGAEQRLPTVMVHRSDNGFFLSSYTPSTTVETGLRMRDGAPLLLGYETQLRQGAATYRFPRAEHRECRVFVDGMESGIVSCTEQVCGSQFYRRRLRVTGLRNATVTVYPEKYCIGDLKVVLNSSYPFVTTDPYDGEWDGNCLRLYRISGTLDILMPRNKPGRSVCGPDAAPRLILS